ncbi:hypothetical protein C8Q77DRAFT_183838 [Trametes polyzona]|nr:hypothetical protein C8Q77DRAFT_183838 [Trametes polyzona]
MSFLFRLFRRLRNPRGFVGRDLEGNQYFEYPGVHDGAYFASISCSISPDWERSVDPRRTKRVVKYAEGRDMWASMDRMAYAHAPPPAHSGGAASRLGASTSCALQRGDD